MQQYNLQRVWDFLSELSKNNNKPWFDEHKEQYQEALADFRSFTEAFIDGLSKFDSDIADLRVADCTYRIYRDIRFSHDKTPYKTHMGVYVSHQGKKSGYSGYYIHIEPCGECMMVSGLYMPTPIDLKSIREEIMLNGENFDKLIKNSKGFQLDWTNALKRIPNGWNAEDAFSEYYKLKDYNLVQPLTKQQILSNDFLEFALQECKKTTPFNQLLNRCVSYGRENL